MLCGEGGSEAGCDGGGSYESGEQEKNSPNHYLHHSHYHPLSLPPLQQPLQSPTPLYHHHHQYQTITTTTTTIPLPPPSLPPSKNLIIGLLQKSHLLPIQQFLPPPQTFKEGLFMVIVVVCWLLLFVLM